MSTLLEAGYDNVKSQHTGERNGQYKLTVAQQWQAGDSIWSRPAIRIFATYANWDEKWGYNNEKVGNANGPDFGLAQNGTIGTDSRGKGNEVTFGAQFEAWW